MGSIIRSLTPKNQDFFFSSLLQIKIYGPQVFLSINKICLKHFETITFQYLGNWRDVSDNKMFFLHWLGQLGGKFIYSTNTDMIHYSSTSVHDTTIDLLNNFEGELSLTNCLNWGKIVWVEEQQTSRCQFFADLYGTVTINHVWKIEMKMGCWHTCYI